MARLGERLLGIQRDAGARVETLDDSLSRIDRLAGLGVNNLAEVRVTMFEARERARRVLEQVAATLDLAPDADRFVGLDEETFQDDLREIDLLWQEGRADGLAEARQAVENADDDLRRAQNERLERLVTLARGNVSTLRRALDRVDDYRAQTGLAVLDESRRVVEAAQTINSGALRELEAVANEVDPATRLRRIDGVEDSMNLYSGRLTGALASVDVAVDAQQEELGRQEAAFDFESSQLQSRIERDRARIADLVRRNEFVPGFVHAAGSDEPIENALASLDATLGVLIGTSEQLDALRLASEPFVRRSEALEALGQTVAETMHRVQPDLVTVEQGIAEQEAERARREVARVIEANRDAFTPALDAFNQNLAGVNEAIQELRSVLDSARQAGLGDLAEADLADAAARRSAEHFAFSSQPPYSEPLADLQGQVMARHDTMAADRQALTAASDALRARVLAATPAPTILEGQSEAAAPSANPLVTTALAGEKAEAVVVLRRVVEENRNRLSSYRTRVDDYRRSTGNEIALKAQRDYVTSGEAANDEAARRLDSLALVPDVPAIDAALTDVRNLLSFYAPPMVAALREVDDALLRQRREAQAATAALLSGRNGVLPAVSAARPRATVRVPAAVPTAPISAGAASEVQRFRDRLTEVRERARAVVEAMTGFETDRRHFHTPKQKLAATAYLAALDAIGVRINAIQATGDSAMLAAEAGAATVTLASFKLPSVEDIQRASKERIRRFPLLHDSLVRQVAAVEGLFANAPVAAPAAPAEVSAVSQDPVVEAVEAAPVAPAVSAVPEVVVAPVAEALESEVPAAPVAVVEAVDPAPAEAPADNVPEAARDRELEALGTEASATRARAAAPKRELTEDERNFRYERDDTLVPSGRVSRIRANLAAIKLLYTLEQEQRNATVEEKAVLAAYSGWGADKEVFNESMAYYRKSDGASYRFQYQPPEFAGWEKEYGKHYDAVKALLTEEEWKKASASVLNAHYTSTELCHGLWDIARRAGFRGGRVLEPAIGSGRIIGAMPEDLAERSEVTGVELDSLTARMAAKMYPEATVYQDAFQDAARTSLPDHHYDLVVSNVPFSDVAPAGQDADFGGDEKYNLHNYFIRRGMDKLKPGGLGIFITSSSTMQNNQKQRDGLARHLQLLGAIRLPNNAFQANANTEVVTDVLLVRKPDTQQVEHAEFTKLLSVEIKQKNSHLGFDPEKAPTTLVNEFFVHQEEQVLGEHSTQGTMYGQRETGQYTVVSPKGSEALAERFAAAVERLPENVPNPSLTAYERSHGGVPEFIDPEQREVARLRTRLGLKPGTFAAPDLDALAPGEEQPLKVGIVGVGGILLPPPWRNADGAVKEGYKFSRGFDADRADELTLDYVAVRTSMRNVIATDLNPAASETDSQRAHAALKEGYEGFVGKWGTFNFNLAVNNLLALDPEIGTALALERVRMEKFEKNGKTTERPVVSPAPILTERTLFPSASPTKAETVEDAVNISLGQFGRVDDEYAARLLGKENDVKGVRRLIVTRNLAFENPATGMLEGRTQYLSGNVVQKLREARKAQRQSENVEAGVETINYTANIAALEAIQPKRIPFEQLVCDLGSTWVPNQTVSRFAGDVFDQQGPLQCGYNPHVSQWLVSEKQARQTQAVISGYGTPKCNGLKVLDAALNRKHIKLTMEVFRGDTKARVLDVDATNAANARADALRDKWKEWVKDNPEARAEIEEAYNRNFNNVVLPEFKGDYLTFPGLAQGPNCMVPRDHQRDVVARLLTEQSGMAAHGVGFGKTFELILTAMESKRTGLANKPMIVCDNASYPQFVQTVRETYPQASILVATEENMSPRNRQTFMSHMATGNWDIILCAHQHLTMMPMRPATELAFRNERVTDLKRAHETMKDMEVAHHTVRQTEKMVEREEAKIKDLMEKLHSNQDNAICFEDTGVDLLEVDEVHKFKKMPFETNMSDVKGVDTQSSQRGLSLLLKGRHIQRIRGDGRGVISATGTPCTNTMAEVWNQIRLCKPTMNEAFNVPTFDSFCASFTRQVTALELNESNGRWRYATRLAKFVNGPQFVQYVRSALDVRMDHANVKLDIPALKGGGIRKVIVPLSDPVADIQDQMAAVYDTWDNLQGIEKRELSFVPLVLMGASMSTAVDPRLIDPGAPDDAESLVNSIVKEVADIYHHPERVKDRQGNPVANPSQVIFCDRYSTMSTDSLNELSKGNFKAAITIDADALVEEKGGSDDEDDEQSFKNAPAPDPSTTSRFNLYHDMRDKLVAAGIKPEQIAIASDYTSVAARKALFERVNSGEVRVVIGSTALLGVGVNIQQRLCAAHHVDPPRSMTPADLTQRNGRILRQGNLCAEVDDIYYGMQDTATPGIMDRVARKEVFTTQVLSGRGVGVEFEDCGAVDTSEMKGLLVSDKRTMQREELRAAIVDQKVKRETIYNRARDLRHAQERREGDINVYNDNLLPRETALAEFFEKIVPPNEETSVTWRYTKGDKEMDAQENEQYEEAKKQLNDLIAEWKKPNFGESVVEQAMGAMTINGLKLRITRQKEGSDFFKSEEKAKFNLHAELINPIGGNSLGDFKFSNAAALLHIVTAQREKALNAPARTRGLIATYKESLAKITEQIAQTQAYDDAPLRELESRLSALESDMAKNPYKRIRRAERVRMEQEAALAALSTGEIVADEVGTPGEDGRPGVFRVIQGGAPAVPTTAGPYDPAAEDEEFDRSLVVQQAVI